jgi:hypothetical protein
MRKLNLSASAMKVFKCCPMHWRLAHVLGIRKEEKPDVLRIGSNWHLLMEKYREAQVAATPKPIGTYDGVEIVGKETFADPVDVALEHLNEAYKDLPLNKTQVEWETERAKLAYAFIAYAWYWANEALETLETEIRFDLPVYHPKTGKELSMRLVGMIDRVVRKISTGRKLVMEYKTTSQDIAPSAPFWEKLRLDGQVSTYAYASAELSWGIDGTYYDMYRKPATNPRLLTQAETKKFMKEGEWNGAVYEVKAEYQGTGHEDDTLLAVRVNGAVVELKIGAKPGAFQIRETPDMYGARLLKAIYADPEKYFQRKEVVRTAKEIRAFRTELSNICSNMEHMMENDTYFCNDGPCTPSAKGGCAYPEVCYHNRIQAVVDGETPDGYRRIGETYVKAAAPSRLPPCPSKACSCSPTTQSPASPSESDG